MILLLDTHALVWLASDPAQLSEPAAAAIRGQPAALHISVVSAWEIAIMVKRGRLTLPMTPDKYLARVVAHHGLIELPLSRAIVLRSVALPDIHRDPFDRVLIAECMDQGMALITRDRVIARYPGIQTIW